MHRSKLIFILFTIVVSQTIYAQNDSINIQINFSFNSFKLSENSKKELSKICNDTSLVINYKIIGRADKYGSFPYNDSLSLKRAYSVYNFLMANGIAANKFSEVIGYGKRKLLVQNNKNKTTINQSNRIVTIKYIKVSLKQNKTLKPVANSLSDSIEKNVNLKDENNSDTISFQGQINAGASNIILKNINFLKGRHILLANSIHALNDVLDVMKRNENLIIEIQGHICCLDSTEVDAMDLDTFENELSLNRAKAVYDYLVAHGIKASRMTYKGFGSKRKRIFPELSEEDAEKIEELNFKL